MAHFVGLDVSVLETAVCVVDETGKVVCEQKVPSEPDDIVTLLTSIGEEYGRIGIEAGPLSQWLVNGMAEAGLPVICVETRHMKSLLKAQQINKSVVSIPMQELLTHLAQVRARACVLGVVNGRMSNYARVRSSNRDDLMSGLVSVGQCTDGPWRSTGASPRSQGFQLVKPVSWPRFDTNVRH